MTKKLTLSIDEAVIDAAKEYVGKQGISLSSYIENILKKTTGSVSTKGKKKKPVSDTPIVDRISSIIENQQLSPEESEKQMKEYYRRKPYMREVMEHLEKKHG